MRLVSSARFHAILGIAILVGSTAQAATKDRPLTKTKFDPGAKQVDMFDGIEEGLIDVKMIAKNSLEGNLLIHNSQQEPLSVKIPEGFVGVPVLPQYDGGGGGAGGETGGAGGGGGQAVGGGAGGLGGGGGGFGGGGGGLGGGGGGFFSIPPERTLRVPYKSVCLEHGKPEPRPRMTYKVIRVEEFTEDAVVQTLVHMVGTGRLDQASAQAAAWHLANGMSWQQLASKKYNRVAAPDTPYFSIAQLRGAQMVVSTAQQIVKNQSEASETEPAQTEQAPATRVRRRR